MVARTFAFHHLDLLGGVPLQLMPGLPLSACGRSRYSGSGDDHVTLSSGGDEYLGFEEVEVRSPVAVPLEPLHPRDVALNRAGAVLAPGR